MVTSLQYRQSRGPHPGKARGVCRILHEIEVCRKFACGCVSHAAGCGGLRTLRETAAPKGGFPASGLPSSHAKFCKISQIAQDFADIAGLCREVACESPQEPPTSPQDPLKSLPKELQEAPGSTQNCPRPTQDCQKSRQIALR